MCEKVAGFPHKMWLVCGLFPHKMWLKDVNVLIINQIGGFISRRPFSKLILSLWDREKVGEKRWNNALIPKFTMFFGIVIPKIGINFGITIIFPYLCIRKKEGFFGVPVSSRRLIIWRSVIVSFPCLKWSGILSVPIQSSRPLSFLLIRWRISASWRLKIG